MNQQHPPANPSMHEVRCRWWFGIRQGIGGGKGLMNNAARQNLIQALDIDNTGKRTKYVDQKSCQCK